MQNGKLSRRDLLKLIGASSATVALAACAAPGGGASPSAGGDAPPADGPVQMSIATWAQPLHDWQREFSRRWAEENADSVELQIEEVVRDEMPRLQLARQASGTLWDLCFSNIKWYPFSASKGMFLELDEYLSNRDDANLGDFFQSSLEGGRLNGTLYGLPYEIHPGNPAIVAINLDQLEAANLEMPTDDWSFSDYTEMAIQLTDRENNIFGMNYLPNNYYDFASLARAFGTELLSEDQREFRFNTDEANRAAARWITSLRTELDVAPSRVDAGTEGIDFVSGVMATAITGTYAVNGWGTTIGDKFRHDWVLAPRGPDGDRGYNAFSSYFSCSADSVAPEMAVDLLVYLTSTEAGLWSALEQGNGQPNARQSVWKNEEVLSQSPEIFERVLNKLFLDEEVQGPFPMPYNLRFQELQDNWANTSPDLFYGDVDFEKGMETVQAACQEIMDLPRV